MTAWILRITHRLASASKDKVNVESDIFCDLSPALLRYSAAPSECVPAVRENPGSKWAEKRSKVLLF